MKRSLAVLAALVLALGVVGLGYAQFTGAVNIMGTVQTGTMKAEYLNYQIVKAPAYATVTVSGSGTNAYVTATNLAPGDEVVIGLALTNTGSLPWNVRYLSVNPVTEDATGLASLYTLSIPSNDVTGQDMWATTVSNTIFGASANLVAWRDTYSPFDLNTLTTLPSGYKMPTVSAGHWFAVYADLKLDSAAGDAYQGKTVTFTLTLNEQLP